MASTTRPTTCGALAAVDPELGQAGCKRLPRHGGDHRGYLTMRQARKAAAAPKVQKAAKTGRKTTKAAINALLRSAKQEAGHPRGRLSAAARRAVVTIIMTRVEAGTASTSAALGAIAAL